MALLIISHEGILNTASTKGNDQFQYADDFAIPSANLQPIGSSQKQTELGIETQALYTLYVDILSYSDIDRFTIGSRLQVRVKKTTEYRKFLVKSKPIVHESDSDLAHIEMVVEQVQWQTPF